MSILEVDCTNLANNPECPHGPTLKFSRLANGKVQTFFACSACRSRKDCPFFHLEGDKVTETKLLVWREMKENLLPKINHDEAFERFLRFKTLPVQNRFYCLTCFDFVFPEDTNHNEHNLTKKIKDDVLEAPSRLIDPIENDKKEAQFWFAPKSRKFVVQCMKATEAESMICMGTPTVHEALKRQNLKTVLLDLDHRYHYFFSKQEFCWFNMFNFHFLAPDSTVYQDALSNSLSYSKVCVLIDPPFGSRIEPLERTVHILKESCKGELYIFLVLPYFMESEVLKSFPNFEMLDYTIEYSNHKKFKNEDSPVRLFTNFPPSRVGPPQNDASYHFCSKCDRWRGRNNNHCDHCGLCPSKNGQPYTHCKVCAKCFKATWKHCGKCGFCALPDHECRGRSSATSTTTTDDGKPPKKKAK